MFEDLEAVLGVFPLNCDGERYVALWWVALEEFLDVYRLQGALRAAYEERDVQAALDALLALRGECAPPGAGFGKVGRALSLTPGQAVTVVTAAMVNGQISPRQAGEAIKRIVTPALEAALPAGRKLPERSLLGDAEDRAEVAGRAFVALEAMASLPSRGET